MFAVALLSPSLLGILSCLDGSSPVSVTVDPSGRFACVADLNSANVSVFTINPSTGALTAGGMPVAAGAAPFSVVTTPYCCRGQTS